VLDGKTGYVIPLGEDQTLADRVCRLLLDQDLRDKLGRQGRERMKEEFSCQKFTENTVAVFREASALRGRRGQA
jgi:spore coat protein SA